MPTNQNGENSIYVDDKEAYNKPISVAPVPKKEIGIDTDNQFMEDIVFAAESSQVDMSSIEQFTRVSQGRDSIYALIDTMCEDSTIASVLETYAEDATERNDNGRIVWAESQNPDTAKYINYLLDSMGVDKNVYKWTTSLCKYGDVYLRLYHQSDYEEDILDDYRNKKEVGLQESVKINAYKDNDHYVHYLEMFPNPAEIFELTRFGKTYAYIKAPVMTPSQQATNKDMYQMNLYRYNFGQKDIMVYSATDFVHGCLEDNSSRTPEKVSIFQTQEDMDNDENAYTYTVKRGQSLFYNVFKIWRELTLLQNAVLLNRITKSSIVRVIQVEVGDMAKENVVPHLQWIKQLFEQKSALDVGNSLNEYTNPGPIENNVYVPTRNGQGGLTTSQVGGDVNVGQLTDLDYFRDLLFAALRVPKQYFGFVSDNAGFSGGQSLAIISSRYAKMVKRIQFTVCQMITDAINILLLDKGLSKYINQFTIKITPPTTQEEVDRRESLSNKIRLVGDVMGMLNEVSDPVIKLKILQTMLSEAMPNSEVADMLGEEISRLEKEGEVGKATEAKIEETSGGLGGGIESGGLDLGIGGGEETDAGGIEAELGLGGNEPTETTPESAEEADTAGSLPSPSELGLDFTDSNNPEFA